ncbi:hypothetical protein BDV12DRAFT_178566 [Aspergillus spectabilis]
MLTQRSKQTGLVQNKGPKTVDQVKYIVSLSHFSICSDLRFQPCVSYDITSATSVRTSVYVHLHMYYVSAITPLCLHDAGASSYA